MDFAHMRVTGYAFQVTLLSQAVLLGAVVREIPVTFVDRKHGESKLRLYDVFEFLVNVWRIIPRLSSGSALPHINNKRASNR
jgi:dolichol-phosphate mannosyltransferase